MNISPQDKAFIITFGSACLLVLVFFFITLSPFEKQVAEEFINIPIIEEPEQEQPETLKKEEMIAQNEPISHQPKNESRLKNEAEEFFSQEDEIREALQAEQESESEAKTEEESSYSDYQNKIAALREKAKNAKKTEATENKPKAQPQSSSTNRRTTISYILNERNAIKIPNPVYTCDAVGKVVINIQVNDNGNVTRTTFNKSASTTSNGCLVDQAIDYASRALFNVTSGSSQLGSITFEFQG
ncbi:MAG TPA: hypothetical protein ENH91_03510 [Leeuwenhoekiella sp.]|nr:hypothetical protein [Leeuwenhoekiella sp.]